MSFTHVQEDEAELERMLASVRDALRELKYGTVTVVVHDGAIVQIDRTEKLRVPRPSGPGATR
jgi:hypothetical protein